MSENRIMDYLLNRMSDSEREIFESDLKNDKILRNQFSEEREVFEGIWSAQRDLDREFVSKMEAEVKSDNHDRPAQKRSLTLWIAAASVTVLLATTYFTGFWNSSLSNDEIVARYDQPLENDFHVVTRSASEGSRLDAAFTAYDLENYEEASTLLENLLEAEYSPEIEDFLISSHFQTAKFDLIIKRYEYSLKSESIRLTETLNWYAALSYLKIDQEQQARRLLKDMEQSSDLYDKSAREVLNLMD